MTAKTLVANRSAGEISDAARRKLARVPSRLPILHAVHGEFQDAVTVIFRRGLELLAKQHAQRVESYAPPIRHALRDEFRTDGAQVFCPAVSGHVVDTLPHPYARK